jgi:hypothetical protein
MAPTFLHGKGTKVLANAIDMSCALNDVSYDHSVETADVTTFCDNDRKYIPGQRTGSMSMSGFHDGSTAETDRQMQNIAGGSSAAVFTVGPSGDTIGNSAALINGHVTSYSVTSPAGDVVGASIGVQFSSQMHTGHWLADLDLRATATTHASVQFAGSSATTRGAIGHFHMTACTTAATGNEFAGVIQDSSDNATWADYITFTVVNSTATEVHERVKSTATCHEFARFHSTQNSTAATYAVALARL